MRPLMAFGFVAGLLLPAPLAAQQVDLSKGSVVRTVTTLRAGEYAWAPEVAPSGPLLLIVNIATQRAVLYRNGVPIGASTVSTGKPGHGTPTGVFTILQKQVEHYSSKYDSAPMPFMQRLTWYGVALHAGQLPGYPASHGCIRLPKGFAKLLYETTKVGMTVVVANRANIPRLGPGPEIALATEGVATTADGFEWHPEVSAEGPVSIVVSAADKRATVLRNGVIIGSGSVTVDGPVKGTWAYMLQGVDGAGQHWIRVQLSGVDRQIVEPTEWQRFHSPEAFRRAVASIVAPGTTMIVTADSMRAGGRDDPVLQSDE